MTARSIFSEQLYDCSEYIIRSLDRISETEAQPLAQKNSPSNTSSEGLHHQAVQTLWKTWMQMRRRTRPWTEILFIGQFPRRTAKVGIHSQCLPGTSRIVSDRLSPAARDDRGDLHHQLGVVASKSTFVRSPLASRRRTLIRCQTCRRESGRHSGRQYARNMAPPESWSACFHGGER
jgi:hypothetical protein